MTFGELKTYIEEQLLESYTDKKQFKNLLKNFKKNISENSDFLKIYSLYNDLSTPQGLSERDSIEYLNEGVTLIQKYLNKVGLPEGRFETKKNNYKEIDELVYVNNKTIHLNDRINNKKKIVETLQKPKNTLKESVNIPVSSMVKVANQTLKSYLENLNESEKKELFEILQENTKSLKLKFNSLKEDATLKLNMLLDKESQSDIKNKITETIRKIQEEKFDQVNYLKLKKFVESI